MIGGGALDQPAANAVRHVAAQNGVWSLGNFGGVPPKSAMMYHQPGAAPMPGEQTSDPSIQQGGQSRDGSVLSNKIDEPDYRYVFNSSTVGMVSNKTEANGSCTECIDLILFFCAVGDCIDGRSVH